MWPADVTMLIEVPQAVGWLLLHDKVKTLLWFLLDCRLRAGRHHAHCSKLCVAGAVPAAAAGGGGAQPGAKEHRWAGGQAGAMLCVYSF